MGASETGPRVAIVYDYLTQMGGGERVLRELHALFPHAPIHTLVYDRDRMPADFRAMDIRVSFIDRLPLSHRKFELYIPLFGYAMEQFDFRGYDLVLSLSTMVAKGVLTDSKTPHVSWCFSPMRWAWDLYPVYLDELGKRFFLRQAFRTFCHYYRIWDAVSSPRVSRFLAGSAAAQARIRKHYGRDAEILHPPIDTGFFTPGDQAPGDFYLIVSRLVLAKRIDLAIAAFAILGMPLVIIGTGEREAALRNQAPPNVRFLGFQDDTAVRDHYRRCKALVFPGEEDFGLTPVEAQACGCPVIAYAAGGALETVADGVHGVLFHRQNPEVIAEAVRRFEALSPRPDPAELRRNGLRFGRAAFQGRLGELLRESTTVPPTAATCT
jgi:glycosyltransferase involved in cell wall biosynthesis